MARLFGSLTKTLIQQLLNQQHIVTCLPLDGTKIFTSNPLFHARRTYISEMRKAAFEGNILRLLRNELQYELQRSPPNEPVTKIGSFTVDDQPGEQWIRLKRKFGGREDIKVEVTMFDGAAPALNSEGGAEEDMQLHVTLIVNISKGDDVLEIMCSAWPHTIEIKRLFIHSNNETPAHPYTGPEFKKLDDEFQDNLYEFLEARGINDELSVFLHGYMKNKVKREFLRWMETVKSFIEKK